MSQRRHYKLVLFGDQGVGKTALLNRAIHGEDFSIMTVPAVTNIAIDFYRKDVVVGELLLSFNCWECPSHRPTSSFYRGTRAALVAYDMTSEASFAGLEQWLHAVKRNTPEDVVVALVGCKSDLAAGRRVDANSALALAAEHDCLHVETSAKNNDNVTELFDAIAHRLTPAVVLTLDLNEACSSAAKTTEICVRSLSGELVARVQSDLRGDTVSTLKKSIAGESGRFSADRIFLVYGTTSWNQFGEDSMLLSCLEKSGWRGSADTQHCSIA